jgi:hypothetical protein
MTNGLAENETAKLELEIAKFKNDLEQIESAAFRTKPLSPTNDIPCSLTAKTIIR